MNTLTVNYGGAAITTRRATVLDNLNRIRLARKCQSWVADDEMLDNLAWKWVTLVTRTTSIEGIPYVLPSPASSESELQASFELFLNLDAVLVDKWTDCANQVNEPINDAKFAPMAVSDPN